MSGAAAAFVGGSVTIAVVLTPTLVTGRTSGGGTVNVSTASVTATPSGGVSPYTYAWTAVTTSPYTWTISAPTAATTYFTCNSLPEGVFATRTFRVTVTDAGGNSATKDISATARNNYDYDTGGFL